MCGIVETQHAFYESDHGWGEKEWMGEGGGEEQMSDFVDIFNV
jgi:hypothetical protein